MKKNVKNIILIIIVILILLATILAVSYSYYVIDASIGSYSSTSSATLPTCVGVSLNDQITTGASEISLSGDYAAPIQDDRLLNSSQSIRDKYRYKFTITNDCSSSLTAKIVFAPTSDNTMPISAVKYLIVSSETAISNQSANVKYVKQSSNGYTLNNQIKSDILKTKNKTITTGYILDEFSVSSSSSYDLYIWIDYNERNASGANSHNSTINKTLNSLIFVTDSSSIGTSL